MPIRNPSPAGTKFTAYASSNELWRGPANCCNSSFEAQINGAPSATSVVYDTDVRENSLPDPTGQAQFGKVILHNITRGNSRKITNVNFATNTITTEASTDDWADNDIITIGSQTCDLLFGYTYSRFFDIDISAEVPAAAKYAMIHLIAHEKEGTASGLTNCFGIGPFEAYAGAKIQNIQAAGDYQSSMMLAVIPINSQKICANIGAFGDCDATGPICILRIRGWWE